MDLLEQYGITLALCVQTAGTAFFISIMTALEVVPAHVSDLCAEAIAQLRRAIDALEYAA
jgi:hypothetical protein